MKTLSKKLESLINNEKTGHQNFANYSLNDIKSLLKYYGSPHKKIKTVHIAGTNGKGSVAHMLNNILFTAGYKTGLYTSPNLIRINERIKINNKEIPNKRLLEYIDDLFNVLEKKKNLRPTYFDALTLFCFRYFHEENVDIAVLEVGLGGRLDSTNVISPLVSIITDISLDHTGVLGSTITAIASEKAGIIKKNSIVITSNKDRNVLDVLTAEAERQSSDIYILNKDFRIGNITKSEDNSTTAFDFSMKLKGKALKPSETESGESISVKKIKLKAPGRFQARNSSLAVAASLLLRTKGYTINEPKILKGILNTKIPGRMQVLCPDPLIIFDPAHNPVALKTTLAAIKENYPDKDYTAVISFMTDKNYSSMFRIIQKDFTGKIFYYELKDNRCFKISGNSKEKKKSVYSNIIPVSDMDTLRTEILKSVKSSSLILITGSFRLFDIALKLSRNINKYK